MSLSAAPLLNVVAFQAGWFACVLGAAHGHPWVGPAAAVVVVALRLAVAPAPRAEARLALAALLLGLATDGTLNAAGAIRYQGLGLAPWCPPPWLLAMWAVFATTLNASLRWLQGRLLLAAALGVIGGPLSYAAGARLRALSLNGSAASLLELAVAWGLALPLLTVLAARLTRASD